MNFAGVFVPRDPQPATGPMTMTSTLHEKRRTILRWWMTSVNALTVHSSDKTLSALFEDDRSTWLWSDGVLPPRLNQFQRGYLAGVLYSVNKELPEFYRPQPSACTLMPEIFAKARAGEVPFAEQVQQTLASIVDLVDQHEGTAFANLGRLLGSMWRSVNLPQNLDSAVETVYALALSIMQMDPQSPVTISHQDVVDCCGSGKRRISIPAVSTAAAFVAAFMSDKLDRRLVVAKSGSAGTTTSNGSADALTRFGIPSPLSLAQNHELAVRHRISFWRCEYQVPNFASLYHGLTFAPTVLSLCAPAVLASPVKRTRIIYGLTDGALDVTARVLARIFPRTQIYVIAGRDGLGGSLIDEPSPFGSTGWSFACDEQFQSGRWLPGDFKCQPQVLTGTPTLASLEDVLRGEAPETVKMMVTAQAMLILKDGNPSDLSASLMKEAYITLHSPKFHSFIEDVRLSIHSTNGNGHGEPSAPPSAISDSVATEPVAL